jgi:hypothetical protein
MGLSFLVRIGQKIGKHLNGHTPPIPQKTPPLSLGYTYSTSVLYKPNPADFGGMRDRIKQYFSHISQLRQQQIYPPFALAISEFNQSMDKCYSKECLQNLLQRSSSIGYSFKNIFYGWCGIQRYKINPDQGATIMTNSDLVRAISNTKLVPPAQTEVCLLKDYLRYQLTDCLDQKEMSAEVGKAIDDYLQKLQGCQDIASLSALFNEPETVPLSLRRILHDYTDLQTSEVVPHSDSKTPTVIPLTWEELEEKINTLRLLQPVHYGLYQA